jgi:hypothetical protein
MEEKKELTKIFEQTTSDFAVSRTLADRISNLDVRSCWGTRLVFLKVLRGSEEQT